MTALLETTDPRVLDGSEEQRLLRGAPWRRLGALGDSIVQGIGDPVDGYDERSWLDRVADALRREQPGLDVLNLGRRDRVAAEIARDQLPAVEAFAPDLVFVNGGANDMFRGRFDPEAVRAEYEPMIARLVATGATVVTWTMFDIRQALELPEPWGSRLAERYDPLQELVRDVSRRYDTVLVDFGAESASTDPGIYSADLLHLNMRGHAIAASMAIRRLGVHLAARAR